MQSQLQLFRIVCTMIFAIQVSVNLNDLAATLLVYLNGLLSLPQRVSYNAVVYAVSPGMETLGSVKGFWWEFFFPTFGSVRKDSNMRKR